MEAYQGLQNAAALDFMIILANDPFLTTGIPGAQDFLKLSLQVNRLKIRFIEARCQPGSLCLKLRNPFM